MAVASIAMRQMSVKAVSASKSSKKSVRARTKVAVVRYDDFM